MEGLTSICIFIIPDISHPVIPTILFRWFKLAYSYLLHQAHTHLAIHTFTPYTVKGVPSIIHLMSPVLRLCGMLLYDTAYICLRHEAPYVSYIAYKRVVYSCTPHKDSYNYACACASDRGYNSYCLRVFLTHRLPST